MFIYRGDVFGKYCADLKMCSSRSFLLFIIFTVLIPDSLVLTMNKVIVPAYSVRGHNVLLECDFDLETDVLYSVKWYRDNEEFYRYLPKNKPAQSSYKLDGIKVNLSASDEHHVTLNSVTLKSSGYYKCEVSAEGPSFHSNHGGGRMEVVYIPKEGPRITGKEQEFKNSDVISLNCTSGRSYPASLLTWYIDGKKVEDVSMLIEYPPVQHAHGLLTTVLGLRIPTGRNLNLKCSAQVAPLPTKGDNEAFIGEPALVDHKEAMLLVRNRASRSWKPSPEAVFSFLTVYIIFAYLWR